MIASGVYVCSGLIGEQMIENYYEDSNNINDRNQRYITALQEYVTENNMETSDTGLLRKWVKNQNVINIELYKDDILIYDSQYPDNLDIGNENIEAVYYEGNQYYNVQFTDGTAIIGIYGMYDYQLYNVTRIAELIVSFLIFLSIVLFGIRRKVRYIMKLCDETEILETGDLDYSITIRGTDELSSLAYGLECMRKSFLEQVNQEAELVQENQRVITEMSHDLRTPITAMMLYLTIMEKNGGKEPAIEQEYLQKIKNKTLQMKELTDHLFEYSLVTENNIGKMDPPEEIHVLFYDLLSEMCSYLEQKGFRVKSDLRWESAKISVSTDYIMRIWDNISSNIIKYADQSERIVMTVEVRTPYVCIAFENKIRDDGDKVQSTEVGLHSIHNMMRNMSGKCIVQQEQAAYKIELQFPIVE